MKLQRTPRGFTLIETLVMILVYSFVMVATADLLRIMYINAATDPVSLNQVDQARTVATAFTNEIRDAAYGNDGSYPLNQASSTQIIFFSPYGSQSSTTVDRIRYYLSGTTLYKGVTAPSGSPATYNLGSEVVSRVLTNVANGTTSVFNYYGGTYAGTSTAIVQPVNVNLVSYVQVDLVTYLEDVRGATTTFTTITGGAIRNLKTNLGN
jgi:type II secretory pathway component PulJ